MLALVAALGLSPLMELDADSSDLEFPEGYPDWRHVKTMVINVGHPLYEAVGGIHSIYGNPQAIQGYASGKQFPDGSVIVFDLFAALDEDNAISEGERKAIIVMAKNSAQYASTDGWGYQVFDPATRKGTIDANAAKDCHGCHTRKQEENFVFSVLR
jgi:hypothetical protein